MLVLANDKYIVVKIRVEYIEYREASAVSVPNPVLPAAAASAVMRIKALIRASGLLLPVFGQIASTVTVTAAIAPMIRAWRGLSETEPRKMKKNFSVADRRVDGVM